jgi:hypothetical protein
MVPVVIHVNNLKQMYGKWPANEQTRWWMAAARILLMDQPDAFLKDIEVRHPVVSLLATGQPDAVEAASGCSSSRRRRRMVQGKATVHVAILRRCRPLCRCNSSFPSGPGRLDPYRMAGRELFKKLNPEKKQEQKLCLFCFKHKADQDCLPRPGVRGERLRGGCHHRSLHWQVAVGCRRGRTREEMGQLSCNLTFNPFLFIRGLSCPSSV